MTDEGFLLYGWVNPSYKLQLFQELDLPLTYALRPQTGLSWIKQSSSSAQKLLERSGRDRVGGADQRKGRAIRTRKRGEGSGKAERGFSVAVLRESDPLWFGADDVGE